MILMKRHIRYGNKIPIYNVSCFLMNDKLFEKFHEKDTNIHKLSEIPGYSREGFCDTIEP